MKHVVIVSPHFIPSNLAAVHRARYLAEHLKEFGWRPTIVQVDEKYYEENLDKGMYKLLPEGVPIQKAWAFKIGKIRLIGDVGLRGFMGLYQKIKGVHRQDPIDFLYIVIPSNYAALLGPLIYLSKRIPYGIDYVDPWIFESQVCKTRFSKLYLSQCLARCLEPIALMRISLITSVSADYYRGIIRRHPKLEHRVICEDSPYGAEKKDHEIAIKNLTPPKYFPSRGSKHYMIYAGALLPKAHKNLDLLLKAIKSLVSESPQLMKNFQLCFMGTGQRPNDPNSYSVQPYIDKHDLKEFVVEHPMRVPYLDVLNHLHQASSVLILGSTERHYTPSKIFQAILSAKPLLGILRKESSAVSILSSVDQARLVTFGNEEGPSLEELKAALRSVINTKSTDESIRLGMIPDQYSARNTARVFAKALSSALSRVKEKAE